MGNLKISQMVTIKLEFEQLQILGPKKRWNIYFVEVTEHPTDWYKMLVSRLSQHIFYRRCRNCVELVGKRLILFFTHKQHLL